MPIIEKNNHENLKEDLWEKSEQSEVIQRLKQGENLQEIMDSLENIQEAFTDLDVIVCSDGRVLPSDGAKLGIAGEGILLSEEELEKFIEANKGKIRKVTSHEDCGAAGVAHSRDSQGAESADGLGMIFAKKLAERLGAEYEHIPMSKMRSTLHDERMICLDGTGKFNPMALKEMPGHFGSSGPGFGLSDEYIKEELKTLTGIALGDHGFGNKFSAENKFYIVVSAKDEEQLERLMAVAREGVKDFGDRVEVKGFVHKIEE